MSDFYYLQHPDGLYHYGVLGMKWGVRKSKERTVIDSSNKRDYDRYTYEGLEKRWRKRMGSSGSVQSNKKKSKPNSASMNKKQAKKWYKENRTRLIKKHTDYETAYDRTREGSDKKKRYIAELKKMYNDDNWSDDKKAQKRFDEAEESYLRSREEYSAKKLIKEYGAEKVSIYANEGRVNTGKDAIRALSDKWGYYAE